MKKYSHAWLAFMAIKRLRTSMPGMSKKNRKYTKSLINWLLSYKDDVIQGAWYPDAVICDMSTSHVLKIQPSSQMGNTFDKLPGTHLVRQYTQNSPLRDSSFEYADPSDNLPDRCESIAHSIVDDLKIQRTEKKGSPVVPTNNHIALRFFMLSHYIADAHMPLHCDARSFSRGKDVHAKIEDIWDKLIKNHYEINYSIKRFVYDREGFPLQIKDANGTYLASIEHELATRDFRISYGSERDNTWAFTRSICQHSYLLAHEFIPSQYDHTNLPTDGWKSLGTVSFDDMSIAVLADAIDSIARVWFRIWRRFQK